MSHIEKQRGKYRARFADPLGKIQSRTFDRKTSSEGIDTVSQHLERLGLGGEVGGQANGLTVTVTSRDERLRYKLEF